MQSMYAGAQQYLSAFPSGTDAGLFAVGGRNRIGRSFENCPYPVDIWNEKFSCIFEYSWYNDLVSNQAPDIERIPCPGLLFSRQSGYFHLRKAGITMSQRIVVALGGNALGKNLTEQYQAARETAKAIVDLIADGNQVVIAHGNGPQVGMIQTAMTELTRMDPEKYIPCPLSVCVAMSQGYIGYDLQNALRETLLERGIPKAVSTVLTQVEVDPDDPAFLHPTKPIGAFMSREEAERLVAQRGLRRGGGCRTGIPPGGGVSPPESHCGAGDHPRPGRSRPGGNCLRRRRDSRCARRGEPLERGCRRH